MSRICIDAGHGGSAPGAVGSKSKEKDINLVVALHLKNALVRKGHKVVLTRGRDTDVALSMRTKIANNYKADLFVSIHCNASVSQTAHGTEVCYKSQRGKDVAAKVQKSLVGALKTKDRGLSFRDDLYVLNDTNMPAILIELAFISNLAEERLLLTKQREIADAIANAIL